MKIVIVACCDEGIRCLRGVLCDAFHGETGLVYHGDTTAGADSIEKVEEKQRRTRHGNGGYIES